MKLGDKTQAIVLSVVAAGAVLFLISRLLPPALAKARSVADRPLQGGMSGLTPELALIKDPFFHPKLARLASGDKGIQDNASPEPETNMKPPPGPLPAVEGAFRSYGPMLPDGLNLQVSPHAPKDGAPMTRAKVTGKPLIVRLDATLRVERVAAVISVGGSGPLTCKTGDHLSHGLFVEEIDATGVTLRHSGRKLRLQVGQELSL